MSMATRYVHVDGGEGTVGDGAAKRTSEGESVVVISDGSSISIVSSLGDILKSYLE